MDLKKFLLILSIALFTGSVQAQKDSTSCKKGAECCISKCMMKHGSGTATAFGGPMASFTNTSLNAGKSFGGGGGMMFGCGVFVGAYGKRASTWTQMEGYDQVDVQTGHGGIWVGGHPFRNKVIHPKWSVKLGYGQVEAEANALPANEEVTLMEDDGVLVTQPEIGVGVNLGSHLLLDIGAGYRFVSGFEGSQELGISGGDLNGFQANIGLSFGSFQ